MFKLNVKIAPAFVHHQLDIHNVLVSITNTKNEACFGAPLSRTKCSQNAVLCQPTATHEVARFLHDAIREMKRCVQICCRNDYFLNPSRTDYCQKKDEIMTQNRCG